ncbi:MAG: flagellar hook-basal body complex protein, partial [Proteobacteria bacterium]|nr:flagellar hook-basal body complex protein [Pseudomonadota bacterium]
SGRYSNGQMLELYKITLGTFNNQWGLKREGGNLFSETVDSGQSLTGFAGDDGKGTIDGNSLEMSNVDMATEFVRMITTQRGFQANTKVITTTDSMLGEVIAMKR